MSPPGQFRPGRTEEIRRPPRAAAHCVECWENNLYVGTADGQLYHYWVDNLTLADTTSQRHPSNSNRSCHSESQGDDTNSAAGEMSTTTVSADMNQASLIQFILVGSGKARVDSLAVLEKARKLVVFCDSTLSFYSLPDLTPLTTTANANFGPLRGVQSYATDAAVTATSNPQFHRDPQVPTVLMVAKRRGLQVYHVAPQSLQLRYEVPLAVGGIRTLCAWHDQFCLADDEMYQLVNLRHPKEALPLIPTPTTSPSAPNSSAQPWIVAIQANEFLIVTTSGVDRSALGMFITGRGDAVRGTLHFTSYPRAVGYADPYIVTLARTNALEIYHIADQRLVQVIDLPPSHAARNLSRASLMAIQTPLLAKLEGSVLTQPASPDTAQAITQKTTVPVPFLLTSATTVDALVLQPLLLQVDLLLDAHRVEEALAKTHQALETCYTAPTRQLELCYIYQKAGLIYLGKTLFDDALDLFCKGKLRPRLLLKVFPSLAQTLQLTTLPDPPRGLADVFAATGDIDHIVAVNTPSGPPPTEDHETHRALGAMLRQNAHDMLARYFEFVQQEAQRSYDRQPPSALSPEALERPWSRTEMDLDVVYPVLVYQALTRLVDQPPEQKALQSKVLDLVKAGAEYCPIASMAPLLTDAHQYYALSLVYRANGQSAKALQLWADLLAGALEDSHFGGVNEMYEYLYLLGDSDLVWELSSVVLKHSELLGAKLFISVAAQDPSSAMVDRVIDRLQSYGPTGTTMYLEFVIDQLGNQEPRYHERLIELLVQALQQRLQDSQQHDGNGPLNHVIEGPGRTRAGDPLHEGFQRMRRKAADPLTFLEYLQSRQHDPVARVRSQLLSFLARSQQYDCAGVADQLQRHQADDHRLGLDSELAVVWGKLGEHERVIEALVLRVQDYESAERYCQRIADDTTRSHYFLTLLKYYLQLDSADDDEDQIIILVRHLLTRYGSSLEPLAVLRLIPEMWTVDIVEPFLRQALRSTETRRRECQVTKSLHQATHLVTHHKLILTRKALNTRIKGPIVTDAPDTCSYCDRPLDSQAVAIILASHELVHPACVQSQGME
ncbi:hypothetical protein H4R34_004520 [Dimargaris verticillata]|uniref:CNH domain-containing protein n=1 Tax=Dimargaris verticillata TaxID=2761393 RepID=A0A9W8B412_9FUNG|nr:hypothetical protein H4R34_004520 [Dimargaris verticillata]